VTNRSNSAWFFLWQPVNIQLDSSVANICNTNWFFSDTLQQLVLILLRQIVEIQLESLVTNRNNSAW